MTHYRVEHPDGYVLTKQASEDDAKTQAKAVFDNIGKRPTLVELAEDGSDTKNKFAYPFPPEAEEKERATGKVQEEKKPEATKSSAKASSSKK